MSMEVAQIVATQCMQAGIPKNTILALLANAQGESGVEPFQGEHNGGGFGIWQFTDRASYVRKHVAGMSVHDATIWETNDMLNYYGQWIATSTFPYSYDDFKKNTGNWTAQTLTTMFCANWERPYSWRIEGPRRQANIPMFEKGINWSGGGGQNPGGNPGGGGDKPEPPFDPRKLNIFQCRALVNKNVKSGHEVQNPNDPNGEGTGNGNSDNNKPVDWLTIAMNYWQHLRDHGTKYSMDYRASLLTTENYSDCSAFVSRALEKGFNDPDTTLYTTWSLPTLLRRHGFECIFHNYNGTCPIDLKAGDVFIWDQPDPHTGILIDSETEMECCYNVPAMLKQKYKPYIKSLGCEQFIWRRKNA